MTKPSSKDTAATPAQATKRKRLVLHKGADGIAVVFDPATSPSVVGFGALKPGVEYVVEPAEAVRLVTLKRFAYVDGTDAAAAQAWQDKQAKATAAADTPKGAE